VTNRAHHPADRDPAELAGDEPRPPAASEPRVGITEDNFGDGLLAHDDLSRGNLAGGGITAGGIAEPGESRSIASQEVPQDSALAASGERATALEDERPDEDEEEVVPEPDSTDLPPSEGLMEAAATTLVGGSQARDAQTPIASDVRAIAASAADERATPRPPEPSAPRISRPPPLPPELSAAELAASQKAFTGGTAVEVTAAELETSASSSPDAAGEAAWAGAVPVAEAPKRPSFRPPWVDEVPDPITPYEKRVSETVKVADLPPVEQSRGRVLANRYLAEEVAEHTACSISYRAYHLALDRAVTVRILLRGLACSDELCQEVRRVAAAASALDSPHVSATLDFGVLSDGWPFVVTEHFQGRTLSALIASDGKFVLRRVMHIGKQLALGLSAAHAEGIVHGLLSPDNVLVVEPGTSAEVAKILGFGIAKARGPVPEPPRSGVFGVPFYVSPEQAACRAIDARSDIYSLGVILYELMTGAPPFSDGDFAGVLCQHLDDDAPSPSSRLASPGALAKALDAIIERCLRKEPERRYQTAAEVADDLVRLEAAAARTKRRPMPEVQKPTTTIHSPHRKADATGAPGAKVIVHDDLDDTVSPEAPEVVARRSSPALTPSSSSGSGGSGAGKSAGSSPGNAAATVRPRNVAAGGARPPRVRVDQATIKISASDRERFVLERVEARGSGLGGWFKPIATAVRRLFGAPPSSDDDTR
jgi:serine/threonine protein kinase